MIDNPPPMPQVNSPFHSWAKWVQQSILRLRTTEAPNVSILRTTRGVSIIPSSGIAARQLGATRMRVKEVFGDYLRCRSVIGVEGVGAGLVEGSQDLWVAKMPDLRHSLEGQTIAGGAVTYDGYAIDTDGTCTRVAHESGQADQNEMVIPAWILGSGTDSEILLIRICFLARPLVLNAARVKK